MALIKINVKENIAAGECTVELKIRGTSPDAILASMFDLFELDMLRGEMDAGPDHCNVLFQTKDVDAANELREAITKVYFKLDKDQQSN